MADQPRHLFGYTMRIVSGEDLPPDTEDEPTLGYRILRALAEEGALVEIGPGVWRHSAEGVTWVPKRED
ncbi:MAG TPA: hypothetical protein VFM12_03175 [Gemmatimonadales bacterium]|nr:hypothetical protein [Gemmatimonadales bacterium]